MKSSVFASGSIPRAYSTRSTRPLPESAMRDFGHWLANEKWYCLSKKEDPDEKFNDFQNLLMSKLDKYFPKKSVNISNEDLPFH